MAVVTGYRSLVGGLAKCIDSDVIVVAMGRCPSESPVTNVSQLSELKLLDERWEFTDELGRKPSTTDVETDVPFAPIPTLDQ